MSETLDLVLKGKWYDMINKGDKAEEYRIIKPYWIKRLIACKTCFRFHFYECSDCDFLSFRDYKRVRFHRGYTSKHVMCFEIKSIRIGLGLIQWGAPDGEKVFIISLGNRLL